MKSEKEVIITEHRETVVTHICDTCGNEFSDRDWGRIKHCEICKKDVCRSCAIITDDDYLEHGNFMGDHPDYYCPRCWELGKDIREEIISLRNDFSLAEQELWQKWQELVVD